jgi:murein DD-endopeptidase MepM/ murein hydrolase activator NlpD
MIRLAASLTLALAHPAGAFDLAQPVDCTLGQTCYIQQFFDRDETVGARDFTCGTLSYDGHDGTDFALPTRAAMAAGVAVLAAAPGTVTGVRDGEPDFVPATPGKECGNGVVIDHGQGWQTQYCHLRQGSVSVAAGDVVQTGTALGLIGQSGQADFPHLHLTLRRDGKEVDPFAPDTDIGTCGAADDDVWADDITYAPGGLLAVGITDAVPAYDAIKAGLPSPDLPPTAPALVIWAYFFGPQAGDALIFTLTGPAGDVLTDRVALDRTQALAFRAVGRRLRTEGWPPGPYQGDVRLMRGADQLSSQTITVMVGP